MALEGATSAQVVYLPSAQWAELTRRSVALHCRDARLWQACTARSDELEAQGVDPLVAVRQALDEVGA